MHVWSIAWLIELVASGSISKIIMIILQKMPYFLDLSPAIMTKSVPPKTTTLV